MINNHTWRPGERVICTLIGSPCYGKPATIIKFAYVYDFSDRGTYFLIETDETRITANVPVLCLESLEERPDENYYPSQNPILLKNFPELFDSNGNLIKKEREIKYGNWY